MIIMIKKCWWSFSRQRAGEWRCYIMQHIARSPAVALLAGDCGVKKSFNHELGSTRKLL